MLGEETKTLIIKCDKDAEIYLNGYFIDSTNKPIEVPRSELVGYWQIKKEGCETNSFEIKTRITPYFWLNVFFLPFSVVGMGIDLLLDTNIDCKPKIEKTLDCD